MFDDTDSTEAYYAERRILNRTYISKRIVNKNSIDDTTRNIRIINKVIESEERWSEAKLKDEIVLRVTPGGKQQIKAKIFEDTRGVFVLTIQRFGKGANQEHYFSFVGEEIGKLKTFIDSLKYLDLSDPTKRRVEDEKIEEMREYLMNNENLDLLIEMAEKNITKRDVVALAYRKEQLSIFEKLMVDHDFFENKKTEWSTKKGTTLNPEAVWQYYFEKNPWIFGYGLNLIFNEPLEGMKLEQVVKGYDTTGAGKRIDGLLKTRGIISSICLVEIKTHTTELLKALKNSYRPDCWQVSDKLNGGISQVQKTSQKSIENIGTKLTPANNDGSPTGEEIYVYQPKTYLLIGNLSEFETEHGVNKEKFSSFELFRKNISNPEIITFDELYERAKFIVYNNEKATEEDPSSQPS